MDSDDKHSRRGSLDAQSDKAVDQLEDEEAATSDKSDTTAEPTELSQAGTEENDTEDGVHPGADEDGKQGDQEETLKKKTENDEAVEAHPREPAESNPLVPEQEASGALEMTEIDLTDQAACKDSPVRNGSFATAEKEDQENEMDVTWEPSLEDKTNDRKVSPFQICRYADKWDLLLMFVGTLSAIFIGAAPIINFYFYGHIIDEFVKDSIEKKKYEAQVALLANSTVTASPYVDNLFEEVTQTTLKIFYLGIAIILLGYFTMSCWIWTTERQMYRIRVRFFRSVMKQHIGWFDENSVGRITYSLTEDISNLQNGLGDTFAQSIQALTTFVCGYILGFVSNWKMTLVSLSLVPLIAVGFGFVGKSIKTLSEKELKAYSKAGCVAAEVFSSIKTVAAFGGESKETDRYGNNLIDAHKVGMKKALTSGIGTSWIWLVTHASLGLSFWYGLKLQREEDVSPGDVLRALLGVLIGSINLGQASPYFEVIQTARVAAAKVYSVIDLKSEIDSGSPEGKKPKDVYGDLELRDVHFTYPMRPEAPVLNGLNLKVCTGQTVALVGSSGCGKSTIIQLLMRFYDVQQGAVVLDGHDVKDLNIKWLRGHISLVQQEPVLFATTIGENIRYGQEDVTHEQIENAAREANAHNFIMSLPEKYDTMVGERGAQLSGGQKQRVAIARALLSNPRILLLDEATSALDTESEALVQQSLHKASQGRTTILIAHRLSTVQNADVIVVLDQGQVVEQGTHHDLMTKKGPYYFLVQAQLHTKDDKESDTASKDDIPEKSPRRVSTVSLNRLSLKRRLSRKASRLSLDGFEMDQSEDEDDEEDVEFQPMKRLVRLSAPEWHYMIVGCVASVFMGCISPAIAVMFSEMLGNFAEVDLNEHERTARTMAGIFVGVGLCLAIAAFCRHYTFGRVGENVTMRLRKMTFAAVIRQEMGWFDRSENQVGVLLARLAKDASNIRWVAGLQLGLILEAMTAISAALIVAFVYGWQLALVILAFIPLLLIAGIVQAKMNQTRTGQKGKLDAVDQGAQIALEAWMNIRTVAGLTREESFARTFEEHFNTLYQSKKRKGWIYGILFSFSQAVPFFCYAASFSFGAHLVDKGDMEFMHVFRVYNAITLTAVFLGRVSSMVTSVKKGKISAGKIFALIDSEQTISSTNGGLKPENCQGKVQFDKVSFSYPTRHDVRVLNHLRLELSPGETLALVGASGCGKSTVVQLLERFYDPSAGHLKLDGKNLQDLDLGWLRSQLGIVSQEPVLFDTSIHENIAYGDNSRQIPMEEIIEAARKANIHNFIHSLPQGYDTNVGEMGTQLSGGQKQRVAIARALLRNPRILLLDEATSALDAESEKSVQEALDKASEGRTCIIIAHRLSTIQGADTIAVIENGAIVERGTHAQLLHKQGHYYNLQQARLEAPRDFAA